MNRILSSVLLTTFLMAALLMFGCTKNNSHSVDLKTDTQKASYAIGQQIGREIKGQGIEVDSGAIAMSIDDVLSGKESRLTMPEMQQVMQRMNEKLMAKESATGKDNKEKGEKFLSNNKTKTGVKSTASGLQYEVITMGKGNKPKATDSVKVQYKGTLLDGTEFDSSYKRNQAAEFPVNGVIKGWTEALQLMPVGSKWKLYIPSELAYGEHGRPGIPANSLLTFEVELVDILKAPASK
jgi:FKBP-type peptidyl-prolyl cis-trans isomerase FkpA